MSTKERKRKHIVISDSEDEDIISSERDIVIENNTSLSLVPFVAETLSKEDKIKNLIKQGKFRFTLDNKNTREFQEENVTVISSTNSRKKRNVVLRNDSSVSTESTLMDSLVIESNKILNENSCNKYISDEEDELYGNEEGPDEEMDYFELEEIDFAEALTEQILKTHNEFVEKGLRIKSILQSKHDIRRIVLYSLRNYKKEIDEEYRKIIPGDKLWKIGIDEADVALHEPKLKELRANLSLENPTILEILECRADDKEKMKLLELFDALQTEKPFSQDYLYLKNEIKNTIEKANKNSCNLEEKKKLNIEEERIKKICLLENGTKSKILNLDTNDQNKAIIYDKYIALKESESFDADREWIKWAISLPYQTIRSPCTDNITIYCRNIKNVLDLNVYGMITVKERIIENLVSKFINPSSESGMITLKGEPGTGKTIFANSIAKALNLPFERITMGGMDDSCILKGSDKHWLGSSPSVILQAMSRMKCANGVILFEEIDKLGNSKDSLKIQDALLHITDYNQNKDFKDAYLSEISHDISMLFYMFTVNDERLINPILLNRLDIIPIKSYSDDEKIIVVRDYIMKTISEKFKINIGDVTLSNESVKKLLELDTEDKGFRSVERHVLNIIKKICTLKTLEGCNDKTILSYNLEEKDLKYPIIITPRIIDKIYKTKKDINVSHLQMYM